MNEIMNISGIACYEKDGMAYLNLEAVARGLGFTQTQTKNGTEYTSIRWETVNRYLAELGFPNKLGKEDFIPENVFYRLAMKAKNEAAEKFQAKIADEVIPSIRRHGAYMTPETLQAAILNPDYLLQVVTALKDETDKRKALESKVEADAPMVLFAGSVCASKDSILIRDLAKLLRQNGVQTGEKRLYQTLRDEGYLIKRQGSDYNMPTQRSMDMGIMEIKETTTVSADGTVRLNRTTKITGKGQQYFINHFLKGKEAS